MDTGLIFGMIVAILIMTFVIIFGYEQVSNVQRLQQQADLKKAYEDLSTAVERIYSLGGESSEKYELTFPGVVGKVCFVPSYRGETESVKETRLRVDLAKILDVPAQTRYELARLLAEMRFGYLPGSAAKVDRNYTLLVTFNSGSVPEWHLVPHLGPSRKSVSGGEILCTVPRGDIRLIRKFDSSGAWVDVEKL